MAFLAKKGAVFVGRFRFENNEYKRSLKTDSESEAKNALRIIEVTLHRLLTGQTVIPEGCDVGDFIVSGGTATPPKPQTPRLNYPTTETLIDRYLDSREGVISPSYLYSQKIHLGHFKKFLGSGLEKPCNVVTQAVVERYLLGRRKIREAETVTRERVTLQQFYKWIAGRQDIPAFPSPIESLPTFKGSGDRPPFRTVGEVDDLLLRGGLTDTQALDIWDCVYLSVTEIRELLAMVLERALDPLSYFLHAIPAYTGMRRGEIIRLQWLDIDMARGYIVARSRKQSRTKSETKRHIDLHPELAEHLQRWRKERPTGQLVLRRPNTSRELTPYEATGRFWQPLRHTPWCLDSKKHWFKIGFHTYRHSFASNHAALGTDQRIIDEWMGHQTEAMRKRYRHLFPNNRQAAMQRLSFVE